MIRIQDLSKYFGKKEAVSNLSFSLKKGDILGFIGPNGAGKSTTMRIITGFLPASQGKVIIDGENIEEAPLSTKRKIGYLPENAPLYNNKSVREFLTFIAELRGYSGKACKKRVDQTIERCFLEPVQNQIIETLSKGYKHRTCFAQAILHDPDILILDEPTDGLDPNQKCEIRNLIKEMGETKAIILSTHILEEVEAVTNKVLLICEGEKIFEGTPAEFKHKSEHAGSIILGVEDLTSEDLQTTLTKVKGVKKVEDMPRVSEMNRVRISHTVTGIEQFSQDIMRVATKAKWKVGELKIDEGNLEEVFAKLTNKPGSEK